MSNNKGILRVLEVAALVFSVVTGASSVGILLWKGGELAHTVVTHEQRITLIEGRGSPTLKEHVTVDDEREKRTVQRIERLESVFTTYLETSSKIQSDLARISQKVDDIKEQLLRKP